MRLRNITSSIIRTSVLSLAIASSASAQCGSYCLADQNQDGVVDASDFTAWINNFNNNDPLADVNQNGVLDAGDYTEWVAQFNLGRQSANGAAWKAVNTNSLSSSKLEQLLSIIVPSPFSDFYKADNDFCCM